MSRNQERLIAWIIEEFKRGQGIDLSQDPMAMQRVRDAAKKAEDELRSLTGTEIKLPFITADASGPKHLNLTLSRATLERLIAAGGR